MSFGPERKSTVRAAAMLLLSLLLLVQLAQIAKRSRFSPALLRVAFADGAGAAESLPEPVLRAATLLNKHRVARFALSPSLQKDTLFLQRIVDYTFPARHDPHAAHLLAAQTDPVPDSCTRVERSSTRNGADVPTLYACQRPN